MTAFCVHCGKPPAEGDHGRCARLRAAVDPPRYCPDCARRMVVQVTPSGWSARCSRHGERSSRTDAHPTGSSPSSFNPVSPTD